MTTSDATNYCLPVDYKATPLPPLRAAGVRAEKYWTPTRIRLSRLYQQHVYRLAREVADRRAARVIYDIGCGPATKLMHFFGEEFEVVGMDRSEAVEYCRATHRRGTFLVADLDDAIEKELRDLRPADLVICADVIEHMQHPERLLAILATLAGESGIVVLSTPERERLHGRRNRGPGNPEHVREWNRQEFTEFVCGQGFDVLRHEVQPQMPLAIHPDAWHWALSRWVRGRTTRVTQVLVCRTRDWPTPHGEVSSGQDLFQGG